MSGAGHYDGAGNLLGLTASLPAAPGSFSGNSLYQYDTRDQLTDEQSSRLTPNTNSYAYDAAGNPTTFKTATGQTFNSDNQNQATGFDLDGNPLTWGTAALTFDTASHLTSVGTTLTAGYNAEGLRAWKQSSAGSTYFLYDGLTPIAEVSGSTGNVTAVNTWGAAGLASRRSFASGSSTFYTFDVQGNAAQRLDLNGNVLGSYTFDAYGTRYSTDNSSDPYTGFGAQFGYYRDAETGLSLLGHRYYDPGQGRFLSRDPAGYGGGLNLYGYAANNPFMFADPTGQDWQTIGGVAGGLIGFGLGGPMGAAIGAGIGGGLGSYFGDGRSGTRAFQDGVYSGALGGMAGGAAGLLGAGLRGGATAAAAAAAAMAGDGDEEGLPTFNPLTPGEDLGPRMADCPYQPTQTSIDFNKANEMAQQMRANPTGYPWTGYGGYEPVEIDPSTGAIVEGHHTIVASTISGVPMPAGTVIPANPPWDPVNQPLIPGGWSGVTNRPQSP